MEHRNSHQRWRLTSLIIFACKSLISSGFPKQLTAVNNEELHFRLPRTDSYILDILPDADEIHGSALQRIDQQKLNQIVRDKNLEDLRRHGGVQGVAKALEVDVGCGINDVECRRDMFGSNTYQKPPPKGLLYFVLKAFKYNAISVLLACSILSLGFGIKENGFKHGWYDNGSITIAVLLAVVVFAVHNFRQSRQLEKISSIRNNIQADVVRDGCRQQISIFDIVVGDVAYLKIGDQIPADGLFLDGYSLQVDESSITGKSNYVDIDATENPFLLSGAKVVDGFGRMLVTSVGMQTEWGKLMSSINRDIGERTPLQARLYKLLSSIGKIGITVAFLVLVVLLARYFTGNREDNNGTKEFVSSKTNINKTFTAIVRTVADSVTIVVAAIPEGLPLAVTLILAYSIKQMMADQAMVRKLSACETMGSVTTICTDKTGTLTMNQMKVAEFWIGLQKMRNDALSTIATSVIELLNQGVGLNTIGNVYQPTSGAIPEFSRSPTEKAILSWAISELNMDMDELNKNCTILHVESFNSEKKRSGISVKKKGEKIIHVHWKGAAEMILAMCSSYHESTGTMKSMDDDCRMKINQIIQDMAANSLRCIAFAYKNILDEEFRYNENKKAQQNWGEDGLTFLGLMGLKDPCRPGVKTAVKVCEDAGVSIKMITGENIFTARAIAIECGILKANQDMSNGEIVQGMEFRNYTEEERMSKVDKIRVMARSSDFDKLLMVRCLKRKGHVVAVTGDGTNNAPAFKEADIGVAMGIQGTEVAKEGSDIVILDKNFASMAKLVRWGRYFYNNIQKFTQIQLTVNVTALVINFVAAVSAGEVLLTAVQLLWVNSILGTLGTLALATDQPTNELMEKPPVGRTEPIITNVMWRNIIAQALYQITILLILQFKGTYIFKVNEKVKDTLIFNTFVLCQIFNEFNARKLEKKNVFEGIQKNWLFWGIIGITLILQVMMVEIFKKFADTERLDWGQWVACIGIAAISWPIGWIVKCIPVSTDTGLYRYKGLNQTIKEKNLHHLKVSYSGVAGVARFLLADTVNGISDSAEELGRRRDLFGFNTYRKQKGSFHFIWEAFKDTSTLIALGAAILSLFFGIKANGPKDGWYDGGSVLFTVFLVVAMSAISKFRLSRQFEKTSNLCNIIQVEVIRGGHHLQIAFSEIVVGDVVCINVGDQIPADGLFLDCHSLEVDESRLTGESKHVAIDGSKNPFLLSGAMVVNGHGHMLVTSVGMNTKWGHVMNSINHNADQQTPLQAQLDYLSSFLCKVFLAIPFLALLGMGVHDLMRNHELDGSNPNINNLMNALSGMRGFVSVNAAVAIVVVAIPEGLPLVIINTLTYSMKKMMDTHAVMVQKLSAIETLGIATTICINKTNMLTLNQMEVTEFWLGEEIMNDDAFSAGSATASHLLEMLQQAIILNTVEVYDCKHASEMLPLFCSSLTEKCILSWVVSKLQIDVNMVKESCTILHVEASNPEKKRSGVSTRKKGDKTINIHWKGDADMILGMCSHYHGRNRTTKSMDEGKRTEFKQIIKHIASKSLGCIAFAYKQIQDVEESEEVMVQRLQEDCLTLLGLVGLKHPCPQAMSMEVKACTDAGVNVKLITEGDVLDARALAITSGILGPNHEDPKNEAVVEGEQFKNYSLEERKEKVDKIRVMARSSSYHKLLMVQCIKEKGHVIAVTCDGPNDLQAVKEANADVVIATGTQYIQTKESSDIIILGGNFISVAAVLKWGRCIYNNIQKFIQFQLTVNVSALVINSIVTISSGEVPLTASQLLWVNLIMDVLGALALATEQPSDELIEKPPVARTETLITRVMCRNLIGQALFQVTIVLTLQFKGVHIFQVSKKINDTLIFNTFVFCQIFNLFNSRTLEKNNILKGIHKNQLFLGIVVIAVVLQMMMVVFLNRFSNTERLNLKQWSECIGLAALSWPIGWVVKCIPVSSKLLYHNHHFASCKKTA
ncbi:PREDICTED: calcium-transporting ATPase 12, plasma membrane-type-like [Nelumbo nucifera]|uniref:Calcium-transporting ATPase n=2 Tax=Nelumbo nucifera TaxID=4432 RepID=A0A1U8BD01_NELNU|nr:PREDICTED: calcium-transporting ATPase 12, plasma membrane-type-like [Nelumbo nucifera]DAD19678.1 TPA_asm: hypothetical protein HUJ06_021141 [Nelumbo nucifera]